MVLYTTKGSRNIPEGGVQLSKAEALNYQKRIIEEWKSFSDTVFLKYGWFASSVLTSASSIYITNMTRSILNIGSHAKYISYLVIAGIPASVSGFWTEKNVTKNSLLMTMGCPMCLHLKFGLNQTLLGVIFPAVSSMLLHLPIAKMKNTFSVPDIADDTKKVFQFGFKLLKPKSFQFQILFALHISLVLLLPYLQEKELNKISKILRDETIGNLELGAQE